MAELLNRHYGGQMFMIDPPVVDELCDLARMTGVENIYRTTGSHALNLKATARRHASVLGKNTKNATLSRAILTGASPSLPIRKEG